MQTFSERVVACALAVPVGKVTTYGHIARAAGGGAMAAQSITSILAKAYKAGQVDIPFHRIVYADGRVWLDEHHTSKRLKLYKQEGILLDNKNRIINFRDILYEYN